MQLDGSDDEDHKSPKNQGSPQSAVGAFCKMDYSQLLACNKFGGDPRIYEVIKKQLTSCLNQRQSSSSDEEPVKGSFQQRQEQQKLKLKKKDSSDSSGECHKQLLQVFKPEIITFLLSYCGMPKVRSTSHNLTVSRLILANDWSIRLYFKATRTET